MKSLFSFFIILVCGATFMLIISPKMTNINELRLKSTEYTDILDQSKELKISLDAMLSAYNSISDEDKTRLDKVIPEKFNNIKFVSDLNNIAFKNAVTVKSIKINENILQGDENVVRDTVSLPYKTVSVNFGVSGQYEQFVRFLKDLETSLRIIDVKSISIKSSQKVGSAASYEYTLEVDTYHLR